LAVYGNLDLGGDVIERGAFREFNLTRDGHIRILDAHNQSAPIGKGLLTDTPQGLRIKGKLNLAVQRAREVLALMKDGVLSGLSVGFELLANGFEYRDGVRVLKALKLWEASVCSFPMNPDALVTDVKTAQPWSSIGSLEKALRELPGISKRTAREMANAGWRRINGESESAPRGSLAAALQKRLAEPPRTDAQIAAERRADEFQEDVDAYARTSIQ
jgi:HK97 family phage prohead protease